MSKDDQYCRLRNYKGSEFGTCSCESPKDCPNPPEFTPSHFRAIAAIDQFFAKIRDLWGVEMKKLDRLILLRKLINAADENKLSAVALRAAVTRHVKDCEVGELIDFARMVERKIARECEE